VLFVPLSPLFLPEGKEGVEKFFTKKYCKTTIHEKKP
jgi:hypothetical protein